MNQCQTTKILQRYLGIKYLQGLQPSSRTEVDQGLSHIAHRGANRKRGRYDLMRGMTSPSRTSHVTLVLKEISRAIHGIYHLRDLLTSYFSGFSMEISKCKPRRFPRPLLCHRTGSSEILLLSQQMRECFRTHSVWTQSFLYAASCWGSPFGQSLS